MVNHIQCTVFSACLASLCVPVRGVLQFPLNGHNRDGKGDVVFHYDEVPGVSLRVRHTGADICAGSPGLGGFADFVDQDKHMAFWTFASRNDPKNDPVILWLTG